jgi:hypothetical protein
VAGYRYVGRDSLNAVETFRRADGDVDGTGTRDRRRDRHEKRVAGDSG